MLEFLGFCWNQMGSRERGGSKMLKIELSEETQRSAINENSDSDVAYLKSLRERILFASPSKEQAVEDARTQGCNI